MVALENVVAEGISELRSDLRAILEKSGFSTESEVEFQLPVEIPLSSEEDLKTLEEWIATNNNNKQRLVNRIFKFSFIRVAADFSPFKDYTFLFTRR